MRKSPLTSFIGLGLILLIFPTSSSGEAIRGDYAALAGYAQRAESFQKDGAFAAVPPSCRALLADILEAAIQGAALEEAKLKLATDRAALEMADYEMFCGPSRVVRRGDD